ncbi:unnamed protein product [Acanthoscelides obtectus]|uniref:Uncharacterized protein n=1 Tax=Acanthoscelides obtectus TaxID=200917 RepID=A0A9P0KKY4_ACAOB|nr:unnamed protein product [Acanthoscelides obtectus]CAK1633083.1 hypothetical protein AOBTE_LOCUS7936 [Acanthoscelides obtectus]
MSYMTWDMVVLTEYWLHPPTKVGDNIIIPTPDLDRAKGDLRNVIGVVLEASDNGFYKIGTKHVILQKLYCRNEFDICAQKFLLEEHTCTFVKNISDQTFSWNRPRFL